MQSFKFIRNQINLSLRPFILASGGLLFWIAVVAHSNELFEVNNITQPKQSVEAPPFSLADLSGEINRLQDYHGKVVLLNFWATFCGPCREEMPSLERLWAQRDELNLAVIGVNVNRDNLDQVTSFVAEENLSFPILMDTDGSVRNLYEVTGLPYSYLIDVDGKILGRYIGAKEWDSEAVRALLRQISSHK